MTINPTVDPIIADYLAQIKRILTDKFVGMYVYGSLAVGDFDPESSDIDFLIVTSEEIRSDLLVQLQAMHRTMYHDNPSRWTKEIEASYIPKHALWKYNIEDRHHPHIDRGNDQLLIEPYDMDWIVQRYSLREYGITVEGAPIHELIAPISPIELIQALWDLMDFWWLPMCEVSTSLEHEGYRTYAILTMCRILYTAERGKIVSKNSAAQWAMASLGATWQPLIQRALDHRSGTPLNTIQDVQALIQFTGKQLKSKL